MSTATKDMNEVPVGLEACQILIRKLQKLNAAQAMQLHNALAVVTSQEALIGELNAIVQDQYVQLQIASETNHAVNLALTDAMTRNARMKLSMSALSQPLPFFEPVPPINEVTLADEAPVSVSVVPVSMEPVVVPVSMEPVVEPVVVPVPMEPAVEPVAVAVEQPVVVPVPMEPAVVPVSVAVEPVSVEPVETVAEPEQKCKPKKKRAGKTVTVQTPPEEEDELHVQEQALVLSNAAQKRQEELKEEQNRILESQRKAVDEQRLMAKNKEAKRVAEKEAAAKAARIAKEEAEELARVAKQAKKTARPVKAATVLQAKIRRIFAVAAVAGKRADADAHAKTIAQRFRNIVHKDSSKKMQDFSIVYKLQQQTLKEQQARDREDKRSIQRGRVEFEAFCKRTAVQFTTGSPDFPYIKPFSASPIDTFDGCHSTDAMFDKCDILVNNIKAESTLKLIAVCKRVFKVPETSGDQPPVTYRDTVKLGMTSFPCPEVSVQLKIESICMNIFVLNKKPIGAVLDGQQQQQQQYFLSLQLEKPVDYVSPSASLATIAGWFDNIELRDAAARATEMLIQAEAYRDDEETHELKSAAVGQCIQLSIAALIEHDPFALKSITMADVRGREQNTDHFRLSLMSVSLPKEKTRRVVSVVEILEWYARGVFGGTAGKK